VIDLLGHLRLLLLTRELGDVPASAPLPDEARRALAEQAHRVDERLVVTLLQGLLAVLDELRDGGDPRLPLELELVRAARPSADRSIDAMLRRLDALEAGGVPSPAAAPPAAAPPPAAEPAPPPAPEPPVAAPPAAETASAQEHVAPPAAAAHVEAEPAAAPDVPPWEPSPAATVTEPAASEPVMPEPSAPAPAAATAPEAPAAPAPAPVAATPSGDIDDADIGRVWRMQVVPLVAERRPSLAPHLEPASPTLDDGVLRLRYPSTAQFQKSFVDTENNRAIVADAAATVLGERRRVVLETLDGPAGAVPEPLPPAPVAETAVPEDAEDQEAALIRGFVDAFDAHEIEEES
jgi:DNA polymerase-3 subunit gamma/tau